MASPSPTLGTLLRRLIDLLDRDVEAGYFVAGLDWRPRYTPVLRALLSEGPCSIRSLSDGIGLTHSAVSQTVSQMAKTGLVELRRGEDARERTVAVSARTQAMVPALEKQWRATNAAAEMLEAELSVPLSGIAAEALDALARKPFSERIAEAFISPEARPGRRLAS